MKDNQHYRWRLGESGLSDVIPVGYGFHACPSGHQAHGMRHYHLIHYVEEGCGTLTVGGEVYRVRRGQAFVIRRYQDATYTADSEKPWEYIWFGFNGAVADRLMTLEGHVFDVPGKPYTKLRELAQHGDTKELVASALGHMMLADLFSGRANLRPDYVKETRDAINSLYMTDISVAEIAEKLGLDRRYLSRIFRRDMGITVMDYLIKVRMEEARRLLLSGISVSRTAELVGYNDAFYFSKSFKRYFGIAPSAVGR